MTRFVVAGNAEFLGRIRYEAEIGEWQAHTAKETGHFETIDLAIYWLIAERNCRLNCGAT